MTLCIELPAGARDLASLVVPGATVLARGDELPAADAWCPLLSLPYLLGGLDAFAVPLPYLHPDPAAVEAWRSRLRAAGATRAVGVCWAGAARHVDDPWRSCDPQLFAALGDLAGVHFVCLQKDRRDEGLPALPDWLDWSDELGGFADTAALIAALDAVVTVDTSVAHIAGALGVPTAVLVTRLPDWRWQLERSDSPWYPSVHIARQKRYGHWPEAIAEARDWLAGACAGPAASPYRPLSP